MGRFSRTPSGRLLRAQKLWDKADRLREQGKIEESIRTGVRGSRQARRATRGNAPGR